MKKKSVIIFLLIIALLISCFGVYYHYGDVIESKVNSWFEYLGNKESNSSYNKLQSLIIQVDANNTEISELEKKINENQLVIEEKLLNTDTGQSVEVEKLRAVNEVFRNRIIDLEKKNKQLENDITVLQNEMSLSQIELEELKAQILQMQNQMSNIENQLSNKAVVELIVENNTYSEKTYNLPNNKKFSQYSVLYFIFYNSGSSKYQSMILPVDAFVKYKNFEFSASDANQSRWMQFSYVNDTQYYIGNNKYVEFRSIYGLKK